MALALVSDMLREADKRHAGIVGFNTFNYEEVEWIIEAAEAEQVPAIIMLHPEMAYFSNISFEAHAAMTKALAERVSVPIGLHLDHCEDFNEIMHAIKAGFTSVMIDGSKLPFEENVAITRKVVDVAHAMGVCVEGELGRIGQAANREDFLNEDIYTKVEDAVAFVERTQVDSLAVAIGSAHGFYVETPHLALDRLKAINDAVDTPLVLHGGSGIPDEQIIVAGRNGVNKLNVGTEYGHLLYTNTREIMEKGLSKREDWMWCMGALKPVMIEYLRRKLHALSY